MHSERLEFPGADGATLAARLDLPDGEPAAYALFAHCFTCSKDSKAAVGVSKALAAEGFGVLRFDFTGLGESEGEFADTDFSSNLEDLLAAVDYLRREHRAPALLVGHSLGGAAVLAAAAEVPECEAVATIGAPSDTEHLRQLLTSTAPQIQREGKAEVNLAGRRFTLKKELLDDLSHDHVQRRLEGLGRALLVLHSPVDRIVDVDHARRIYQAAKHPKSFVSLDDADHLLSDRRDAHYAAHVLAAWASRYLPEVERPPVTLKPVERGTVRVAGGAEGYRVEVRAGRHLLAGDEPRSVGGTDTGPTPYDFLLAALGACTAMTLRMYADRKKWPLERTEVTLEHSRIHAEDCDHCETEEGKIARLDVRLAVEGELDDEQRARLLEIAHRCPVHRTLKGEIDIPVELE